MANIWWIALLLLPATAHAQSGESDDEGPSISCTSHVSMSENSLTCHLGDLSYDESEDVEDITLCSKPVGSDTLVCLNDKRDNFTFKHLQVFTLYNLTAKLKGGATSTQAINLKKIVKPKAPWVENITNLKTSDRVVIHIGSLYKDDYLKPNNLLFQLRIWSRSTIVPVGDINYQTYFIEGEYLQKNTKYHVRVRAKPVGGYFDGFWSDWSPTANFTTYKGPDLEPDEQLLMYLPLAIAPLLLITLTAAFFWRKRILSVVWPNIPQPKHTLVQLYHPSKGLPMSFNPEVFNDVYFHLVQQVEGQGSPEITRTDAISEAKGQGLNGEFLEPTSDHCTWTEGSTDSPEEEPAQTDTAASFVGVLDLGSGPDTTQMQLCGEETDPESVGVKEQGKDEAYVTMSSFYQVK